MADAPVDPGENVFLVPSDPDDFERTVASPVDLDEHDGRPSALEGLDAARLWGARDGTRSVESVERMQPGDLLLFYGDGAYVGVGRVGTTFEDEAGWVAETFWEDGTSTHVFTVTDFAPLAIDRAAVNRLFEYSATYVPGGLMRVAPERVPARLASIELAVRRFDEQQG